jgi:hypothetical protein
MIPNCARPTVPMLLPSLLACSLSGTDTRVGSTAAVEGAPPVSYDLINQGAAFGSKEPMRVSVHQPLVCGVREQRGSPRLPSPRRLLAGRDHLMRCLSSARKCGKQRYPLCSHRKSRQGQSAGQRGRCIIIYYGQPIGTKPVPKIRESASQRALS